MQHSGKEPKKIYAKPVLVQQKMTLGVYGDYDRSGKNSAGKLSDDTQIEAFE